MVHTSSITVRPLSALFSSALIFKSLFIVQWAFTTWALLQQLQSKFSISCCHLHAAIISSAVIIKFTYLQMKQYTALSFYIYKILTIIPTKGGKNKNLRNIKHIIPILLFNDQTICHLLACHGKRWVSGLAYSNTLSLRAVSLTSQNRPDQSGGSMARVPRPGTRSLDPTFWVSCQSAT